MDQDQRKRVPAVLAIRGEKVQVVTGDADTFAKVRTPNSDQSTARPQGFMHRLRFSPLGQCFRLSRNRAHRHLAKLPVDADCIECAEIPYLAVNPFIEIAKRQRRFSFQGLCRMESSYVGQRCSLPWSCYHNRPVGPGMVEDAADGDQLAIKPVICADPEIALGAKFPDGQVAVVSPCKQCIDG